MTLERRLAENTQLAGEVREFRSEYLTGLLPAVSSLAQDIASSPSRHAAHWDKLLVSQAFDNRFDEGLSAPFLQSLYGVATSRRNPYDLCEELQADPLTPYYAHQASFFIAEDESGYVIPRYRKLMIDGAPVPAVMHTHFDGPMLMNAILNLSVLEKDPKSIDLARRAVPLMTAHDSIEDGKIPDEAGGLRVVTIADVLLHAPDEIQDLIRVGVPLLTEPTHEELTDVPKAFVDALDGILYRFGNERATSLGMPEKQDQLEEIYRKYGFEYGLFVAQVENGVQCMVASTKTDDPNIGEAIAMVEVADRYMDVSDLSKMYDARNPLQLEKALAHAASKHYMVNSIRAVLDDDRETGSPKVLFQSINIFNSMLDTQLASLAKRAGINKTDINIRYIQLYSDLFSKGGLLDVLPEQFGDQVIAKVGRILGLTNFI